jgi:hypothetical protein
MKVSILRFALLKTRTRKVLMLCAALAFLAVAAFFATARYGDDGAGIHYISRSPMLTISWGPRSRFIIQSGINLVPDRAPLAQAGNFIEFGLPFSESRVSLRLFSWSWLSEEYVGWRSNHAAGLMKKRPNQAAEQRAGLGRDLLMQHPEGARCISPFASLRACIVMAASSALTRSVAQPECARSGLFIPRRRLVPNRARLTFGRSATFPRKPRKSLMS